VNALDLTEEVLASVRAERERQNAKWGLQRYAMGKWLAILVEEVGEVAQAMQPLMGLTTGKTSDAQNVFEELIHVSAVACAIAEQVLEFSTKKPPYMDLDDE
jgi:NTP pyrophosphatase (non-canonical NTP hydrolase)